jgi:phosphopentomutase
MKRALVIVLDSVGSGGAREAAAYGNEGADTLGIYLSGKDLTCRTSRRRVLMRRWIAFLKTRLEPGIGLRQDAAATGRRICGIVPPSPG